VTSKAEKLRKICKALKQVVDSEAVHFRTKAKTFDYEVKVKRFRLRQLIQVSLGIIDAHTVNNWVTFLLSKGIIRPNPHTQLSAKKKLIKPTNDTLYVVNEEFLEKHTHIVRQSKLTKFYEKDNTSLSKKIAGHALN